MFNLGISKKMTVVRCW